MPDSPPANLGYTISQDETKHGLCQQCAQLEKKDRICVAKSSKRAKPRPVSKLHPLFSQRSGGDADCIGKLASSWPDKPEEEQIKNEYCKGMSKSHDSLIFHAGTHAVPGIKCAYVGLEPYLRKQLYQKRLSDNAGNQSSSENPESSRKRKGSDSDVRAPKKRAADDHDEMGIN
ncbi:hypothetical protein FQN50_006834 [Emmonsiellopsis sp. PD_5]|nr:hypothetical protein FQN50_006834 [Emmonsiellopsis sp. PD_5]